jgi:hypothetical protein
MVSWIEERECERVNGREREAARVGTHDLTSGAAGATWRGNSARVTRTTCNGRTVRAARADCPCGEIGLLHPSPNLTNLYRPCH